MPGPKAHTPAPIDRPLAKAYLRKFTGWSTAYPPGMSESTSMRVLHNCNVAPDSSLRIRPGLRHVFNVPAAGNIVGTFEHFYTNSGKKALLFAIRDTVDNKVKFKIAVYNSGTKVFDVKNINDVTDGFSVSGTIDFAATCTYVKYVQIDNKILALSDNIEPFRLFTVGSVKTAKPITAITRPNYDAADRLSMLHPTAAWIAGAQTIAGTAEAPTGSTLISSTAGSNVYSFGYFYTFNNEIGESAPSMVNVVRTQRRTSAWQADASDPSKSPDQLQVTMPNAVWAAAAASGAISWNLYYIAWSDQEAVPSAATLLRTVGIVGKSYASSGWTTHTPLLQGEDATRALPSPDSLINFSAPSSAGQGIVAGDRLVLVYDKLEAARIKWSSNQQGDYLNFSSSVGGGYKTLTSGNLFLPACVKLWQNPQSVDTLTVLCKGLDGQGTSYYMAPGAQVTTQSQAAVIMGFEETTATPGTVSPYGCEVLNNALYHPLDNNLVKSTASNYNISHVTMADKIQNVWHEVPIVDKTKIVSSQMDSTLYYLIQSPLGWITDVNATGNQVWLCDTGLSNIWSCWDVAGTSLQKLEVDGLLYMGISSGRNLYVFDQEYDHDDEWDGSAWIEKGIPWEMLTNIQGANRAHDAPCNLQQVNVTFGNFTGECVYGIRGKDINGKMIEFEKHFVSPVKGHSPLDRYDQQDFLLVRKMLIEWEFFWRSSARPKNRSYGSINFVQYRYTPVTVNVGYEYGSIETFEYGQRSTISVNGVPIPFADTSKP